MGPTRIMKNIRPQVDVGAGTIHYCMLLTANTTKVGVDLKTYISNGPNERRKFRNVRWLSTWKLTEMDSDLARTSGSSSIAQVEVILGVQCLVKSREICNARASISRRFFYVPQTIITPPVQHSHLRALTTLCVLNSASLTWGHCRWA